jgi:hypothetical protein
MLSRSIVAYIYKQNFVDQAAALQFGLSSSLTQRALIHRGSSSTQKVLIPRCSSLTQKVLIPLEGLNGPAASPSMGGVVSYSGISIEEKVWPA